MLGARARHGHSRPCWHTRCPCPRSRCRCSDHHRRRGDVVLLSRRRGQAASASPPRCRCIAVAPTLSCSCRSDIAAVVDTLQASQLHHCYNVTVAPTIAAAAVALPSRCLRAIAVVVRRPQCLGWARELGTNAHGLVHACVVLARSCVAVAPSLSRSCCSNHRRRCGHLAVTLP